MNKFNMVFSGLMFVVSGFHAVSSALKYGISWEVQTVINGVVETTSQNTFLNIIMSGIFAFMFMTNIITVFFVGIVDVILRREKKGEGQ